MKVPSSCTATNNSSLTIPSRLSKPQDQNSTNNDHGHVSNRQLNNKAVLVTNDDDEEFAVENSMLELISEVEEH